MRFSRLKIIFLLILTVFCLTNVLCINADDTITVKGTLKAPDQSGINQPVRNAKVKIYDEESYYLFDSWVHLPWGDDYIKTVYTNDNGFFSTSINNNDGSSVFGDENGRDIYLVIESENTHSKVTKGPSWRPLKGVFKHQTGTKRERSSQADFGTITITGDTGIALDILSNIELGWRYVRDQTGIHLPKANVYYKDGIFTPGESYCLPDRIGAIIIDPVKVEPLPIWLQPYPLPSWGLTALNELAGIHLSEDNMAEERRYEIIFHEYGHYFMDKIGDLSPPWPEMLHDASTPYSKEHAFIEGFAEFFSAAVREEYGITDALNIGGSNNIETLPPIGPESRAAEIEFNVAAVLWDIFDNVDESWDESNIDFNTIVNTIKNYDPDPSSSWYTGQDHPWTIFEFFEGYISAHPGDPSIPLIWRIFERYNIDTGIEDTTPPTTPTGYTSSHNHVMLIDDDTVEVILEGVTDDFSGVASYKYSFVTRVDREPNYWQYSYSPHITSMPLFDDTYYLLVYVQDNAGNIGERYITGPLLVGENPFIELDGSFSTPDIVYVGYHTSGDLTITSRPNKLNAWVGQAYQIPTIMEDPEISDEIAFSNSIIKDGPFQLKILGQYIDSSDNEDETIDLVCDKTPPNITITLSGPYFSKDPKHVCRETVFKVDSSDSGIGVKSIDYRFGTSKPWKPYTNPIQTPIVSEELIIFEVRSIDFLGNDAIQSLELFIDKRGPDITLTTPLFGTIFNDEISLQSQVYDETGVEWVKYSLRNAENSFNDIGFDDLNGKFVNGKWVSDINLNLLEDGEYVLSVESSDQLGNIATISYDIINMRTATASSEHQISFNSDRDGDSEIFIMDKDGTDLQKLTTNSYSDEHPCLSPDGSKIVFESNRDGNNEIYVMNSDGTDQTRLTNNWSNDMDAYWSPDGSQIVFSSNRDGNFEIYIMKHDGSDQTRITENNAIDGEACWSPDGKMIAYTSNRDNDYEIFIMNSDGTEQIQLTNNYASDGDPDWSPDGSLLVFNSDRNRNYEIYTINVDSFEEKRVTINSDLDGQPIWSPDGSMIAFTSERDGNREIYVMNADGTNQTNLTYDKGYDSAASWVKQYLTVISQTGVESDYNGDLLKIDDQSYTVTELPLYESWIPESMHSFAWVTPLAVSDNKRYVWVSSDGLSSENAGSFSVTGNDDSLLGTYQKEQYIEVRKSSGGLIDLQSGWYSDSDSTKIMASPSEGYGFVRWIVSDGLEVDDEGSQETMILFDVAGSVEAYFEKRRFSISVSSSSGGEISPSGNIDVDYGEDQDFTFSPLEGYRVNDVLIDGVSIGDVNSYSFTHVNENHTIEIDFQEIETGGIPGYPLESIISGIMLVSLILSIRGIIQKTRHSIISLAS